jgi:mannose/fructose/N-acetylgalactosamine-specific phosphotransferase system component IIB
VIRPDRIVVSNDRIAKNSWERKFYTSSVPPHIKVSFLTLEETAVELLNNLYKNESVLMLFECVTDLYVVVEKGVKLEEINIGGLHYRAGAHELLPYVFLTEEDKRLLRELVKKGITLLAQDVPGQAATVINSMVV